MKDSDGMTAEEILKSITVGQDRLANAYRFAP